MLGIKGESVCGCVCVMAGKGEEGEGEKRGNKVMLLATGAIYASFASKLKRRARG